jgi:hypothetical protein
MRPLLFLSTRLDPMTRIPAFLRQLVNPAISLVIVLGCVGPRQPRSDSSAPTAQRATTAAAYPSTPPDPAQVIALAAKYQFVNKSWPVRATRPIKKGVNKGVPKGQEPQMTIEQAKTVSGTSYPPGEEILARIQSDRPYQGLGIDKDYNYIWRRKPSSDPAMWEIWLVSAKHGVTTQLERDAQAYSSGMSEVPRLVYESFQSASGRPLNDMTAFGACFDDSICTGHCGYSQ